MREIRESGQRKKGEYDTDTAKWTKIERPGQTGERQKTEAEYIDGQKEYRTGTEMRRSIYLDRETDKGMDNKETEKEK